MLEQQVHSYRTLVDITTWTDISRWLEHAHLRKEVHMPHILSNYKSLKDAVRQLIHTRRSFQALQEELLTLLQDDFARMWETALLLLAVINPIAVSQ